MQSWRNSQWWWLEWGCKFPLEHHAHYWRKLLTKFTNPFTIASVDGDVILLYYASIDLGRTPSTNYRGQNIKRGLSNDDSQSAKNRLRIPVKGQIQLVVLDDASKIADLQRVVKLTSQFETNLKEMMFIPASDNVEVHFASRKKVEILAKARNFYI